MIFNSINKKCKETDRRDGFTLIEVIVTVLILAILGSMVITFFGSSITESSAPLLRLKKSTDLRRVMANMTADYKKYPIWKDKETAYKVDDIVIPTIYHVIGQRYYYKCTTLGTSGSNEPAWIGSGIVNDKTPLVWTYQGTLPTLSDMKTKIDDDSMNKTYNYGYDGKVCTSSSDCASGSICNANKCKFKYDVIENKYITFDASNNEQDAASDYIYILKVSIKSDSGEILSTMFF